MIEYTQSVYKNSQPSVGAWLMDKSKKQPNDVHVYVVCYSGKDEDTVIVLGHNTQDLSKVGGTPLALVLAKNEISVQYKCSETSIDIVPVDPEVVSRHMNAFLAAVRDETLAKPFKAPKNPTELKE